MQLLLFEEPAPQKELATTSHDRLKLRKIQCEDFGMANLRVSTDADESFSLLIESPGSHSNKSSAQCADRMRVCAEQPSNLLAVAPQNKGFPSNEGFVPSCEGIRRKGAHSLREMMTHCCSVRRDWM